MANGLPFSVLLLCVLGCSATHTPVADCSEGALEQWPLEQNFSSVWQEPDGVAYGIARDGLYRITDGGQAFSWVPDLGKLHQRSQVFVGPLGAPYYSVESPPSFVSPGLGATVPPPPLEFACRDAASWKATADAHGRIYVGEYGGDWEDSCAYIYATNRARTRWTRVYAGTERHVHFVAADPYTDRVYASLGDGPERARIIVSESAGDTWRSIRSGHCDAQPVSMAFGPDFRVFGSDCGGEEDENGIHRSTGERDEHFEQTLILDGPNNAFVWAMARDPDGVLFAGTVTRDAGDTEPGMYLSEDDGQSWCRAKGFGRVAEPYAGVQFISNFDADGYAYYFDSVSDTTYRFRYRRP